MNLTTRNLGRVWEPFRDVVRLSQEFDRLFGGWGGRPRARSAEFPLVNVHSDGTGLVLHLQLPGVDPASIEVATNGNTVTIKGTRPQDEVADEAYHRRERLTGEFTRTFQLSFDIDGEKTSADYQKGILTVTLRRPETQLPRKVAVKLAE